LQTASAVICLETLLYTISVNNHKNLTDGDYTAHTGLCGRNFCCRNPSTWMWPFAFKWYMQCQIYNLKFWYC